MKNIYYVDGRISLKSSNYSYVGMGKIELLEKIKKYGSLKKAAIDMKMSYRKAWISVKELNNFSNNPLVILRRGGKNGGYAEVTEYAEKVILAYKKINIAFNDFLKKQTKKLDF